MYDTRLVMRKIGGRLRAVYILYVRLRLDNGRPHGQLGKKERYVNK